MENLTHTLLGLSVAKAGLERVTPLATTTLVVSSNLPDIDVLSRFDGGTLGYLEYHRGFTHGFVGLAVLAGALTIALMFIDRRFRLRSDPFRRPLRPTRIFLLSYLGGLGHSLMDWTNSYGIRPLVPFSHRWFYGDLAFVVDPWIWLILGSAVVWLTTTDAVKTTVWMMIAIILSLIVGLAVRQPYTWQPVSFSPLLRAIWFVGLAAIIAGCLLRWRRRGESLARYSLFLLLLYYGGMWLAHQSAMSTAQASLNVDGVTSISVWPTPANPTLWQAVAAAGDTIYTRTINLNDRQGDWQSSAALDPKLAAAMRRSEQAGEALDFMRYIRAAVEQLPEGRTVVSLQDVRFDLRMRVELDAEMNVTSTEVRWF